MPIMLVEGVVNGNLAFISNQDRISCSVVSAGLEQQILSMPENFHVINFNF